jgi:hypothetical protein
MANLIDMSGGDGGVALKPKGGKWQLKMTEKELMDSIEAVSDSEVATLVDETESVASSSISASTFAEFEFQGFDPKKVVKKLLAMSKAHGIKEEDLRKDIMFMVAANLYMGNLSGKALIRRSKEGNDRIADLAEKYIVHVGSTGTGLPSDALTFPRIANSFPVMTCRMATVLPTKDFIGKPFNSMEIPRYMRVGAFASFCKKEMDPRLRLFLLEAVASYSCDQSVVFEEGRLKKAKKAGDDAKINVKTIAGDQWTYIQASADSPFPLKPACIEVLKEFNILGQISRLIPVVDNYRKLVGSSEPMPTETEVATWLSKFLADL